MAYDLPDKWLKFIRARMQPLVADHAVPVRRDLRGFWARAERLVKAMGILDLGVLAEDQLRSIAPYLLGYAVWE